LARTRLLKPDFFHDEDLAELPFEARLLFAGLWTIADREGRLEDRPKRIKAQVFPYDDVNVDALLDRLAAAGFISRYAVDGLDVVQVRTFVKHQNPHHREPASVLPTNLSENAKPRLVQGEAVPNQGAAPDKPQPSRAVFDTDTDTVRDPVRVSRFGGSVLSGSLHRDHLSHILCSPNFAWCVPEAVHVKLAVRLAPKHGGDVDAAKQALVAWYPTVWDALPPGTVLGDAFRFWGPRFDTAFASTVPVSGPSKPVGCKHVPPCVDDVAHTQRKMREAREVSA